jgi:hypothetical protein
MYKSTKPLSPSSSPSNALNFSQRPYPVIRLESIKDFPTVVCLDKQTKRIAQALQGRVSLSHSTFVEVHILAARRGRKGYSSIAEFCHQADGSRGSP